MTGPAHDPHFHCLLFAFLVFIGAFLLGQVSILKKFKNRLNRDPAEDGPECEILAPYRPSL